jgi:hypothetical protein
MHVLLPLLFSGFFFFLAARHTIIIQLSTHIITRSYSFTKLPVCCALHNGGRPCSATSRLSSSMRTFSTVFQNLLVLVCAAPSFTRSSLTRFNQSPYSSYRRVCAAPYSPVVQTSSCVNFRLLLIPAITAFQVLRTATNPARTSRPIDAICEIGY